MTTIIATPPRAAADGQRARVASDAVVSAYIHELARPAPRPGERADTRRILELPPRRPEALARAA